MKQQIILASSSPRREEILKRMVKNFKIIPSKYEEDMTRDMDPNSMALEFSKGKAQDVAKRLKKGIVIGIDTFVIFRNHKLGKPHTKERAIEMLKIISGKKVEVISGVCIINIEKNIVLQGAEKTEVKMKRMSGREISEYVATGEPMDKAGAFAMQELGGIFVEKIYGCPFNVVGLPVNRVYKMLKRTGYDVLDE